MVCAKCRYKDDKKNEVKMFHEHLCKVCATFAPKDIALFKEYIAEKIDWRLLDTFRNKGEMPGHKKKKGMHKTAERGSLVTRAPIGYSVVDRKLMLNKDAVRIRGLFKRFLKEYVSLNVLAKEHGLSVNGLKKVLRNRTYLGEIKFDSKIHKGDHEPLISPEVFYAVQRKLDSVLRPRKHQPERYKDLKGETEPLTKEEKATKAVQEPATSSLYDTVFSE